MRELPLTLPTPDSDSASHAARDGTLTSLFYEQIRLYPHATALVCGDTSIEYVELARRANRLARYLRSRGVGPGVVVAFSMPRSIEAAVCTLGIVIAGGAYLPLDPDYPAARLSFMLEDSGAILLLVGVGPRQRFEPSGIETLELDAELTRLCDTTDDPLEDVSGPEHLACVLYTSGSTGMPKGVMIRNTSIVGHVRASNWIEFKATDRIAQVSNLSFDPATSELWGAWLHGAALVMLPPEALADSKCLSEQIRSHALTVMFLPAGLLKIHASRAPHIFGPLDTLGSGGEHADPVALSKILQSGSPPRRLLNLYGPTEATTLATFYELPATLGTAGTTQPHHIPIGIPVTGARCVILDSANEPILGGGEGELCIGGRPLTAGYLGRPELTSERFVDDPTFPGERLYRTGDLARRLHDGSLHLLGRIDEQIKVRDYRIEPGEVLAAIAKLPGVESSYVMLRGDVPDRRQFVGYVVFEPGAEQLESAQLRKLLREVLPAGAIPDVFVVVDQLPLTPNGKVDRKTLPRPEDAAQRRHARSEAVLDARTHHPLPLDRIQTRGKAARWNTVERIWSRSVLDEVARLAASQGISIDSVFLSGWVAFLNRWSEQSDFILAVSSPELPMGAQSPTDAATLHVQLDSRLTFVETCQRIVDASAVAGDAPPLNTQLGYSVATDAFEDATPDAMARCGVELWLAASTRAAHSSVRLTYREDCFEHETAERLLHHYMLLLEHAVAKPSLELAELPLLAPADVCELLERANATAQPFRTASSVTDWFEEQARKTPHAVALIHDHRRLTYAELNARANKLAHYLRASGVGPDVIVGICVSRSAEMVIAILGVLKAGGAYLPLDAEFPRARLRFMLEDSGCRILLTESTLSEVVAPLELRRICLDLESTEIAAESDKDIPSLATPDSLAYVIYTSGSTGTPKGVMIPRCAVVNFLSTMQRVPGIAHSDRVLAITTLSFDIAVLELFLPLVTGATVVLAGSAERQDPARLAAMLEEFAITLMQATPTTLSQMVAMGWSGRPNLRLLVGGEALKPQLATELLRRCGELWNMYGPTETTVWSTCGRVSCPREGVFIGTPVANTRCLVLGPDGALLPSGVFGELCIGGAGLARGYLNRTELTSARFIADPLQPGERLYRTGDRVRWRSGGILEFSGRLDRQVKLRGFRIEFGEIEACLEVCPGVERSIVIVREDRPDDQRLVAYVVGRHLSAAALRERLASELPRILVPSAIVVLEELPTTPNGKVDLNALPRPSDVLAEPKALTTSDVMSTLEKQLALAWEDVLNVHPVRLDDDFFELGGHSLLALILLTRIAEQFGHRLTLASFLEAPTVRAQARLLDDRADRGKARGAVPIQAAGARRPLFFASGWGGPILSLRALARALGPDQPVYLLDYFSDPGVNPDHNTIESIAYELIAEMRTIQPQGPYQLAGYSLGAKIVYEMARQLALLGEPVPVLVLLDSYAPGHPILPPFMIRTLLHVRQALKLGPIRMWPYLLKYTIRLRRFVVEVEPKLYEGLLSQADSKLYVELERSALSIYRAHLRYEIDRYAGPLMLIRASDMSDWGIGAHDVDPTSGWGEYVDQAICVGTLESTHSRMLEVANATSLATLLQRCFAIAEDT